MNILVVSDNIFLINTFKKIVEDPGYQNYSFVYRSTAGLEAGGNGESVFVEPLKVKENVAWIKENFQLVISAHCKQIFPDELVNGVRCINIHPGLNPHNRGWYPQVFSIINKLPSGATIHEIDTELDHGPIIAQKQVDIKKDDTSLSAYNKIQSAEIDLITEHLPDIILNTHTTTRPEVEGNVNLKSDFNKLREINLSDVDTFENHIDKLRALSHGEFKNAFFFDPETGEKIFLTLHLQKG